MIPVNGLVSAFREIIGWPYVSPGSNDSRGIDCSGAFVFAYKRFGERIYHGSNRIIREYCRNVRTVTDASQLRVGMAIFKSRSDLSRMSADYKPGGRYYNPALPYDYYHVGLVTSVRPLEIINATTPRARVDSDLRRWCCAGELNAVSYGAQQGDEGDKGDPAPDQGGTEGDGGSPSVPFEALVTAPSGGTVNLRRAPDRQAKVLARVPLGQTVTVLELTDDLWRSVRYESTTGYMMKEFLSPAQPAVQLSPSGMA